MENNEIVIRLLKLLSSDLLWLYFILVILFFYLILSLITWSFIKPLKFLGIPSIIAGLMMIATYFVIGIVPLPLSDTMLKVIDASIKPVFNIGLVCLGIGILMIILPKMIEIVLKKQNIK